MPHTPGQRLRQALKNEQPLQMVGTVNAYSALLAERAGFKALYLSGAGVANASLGMPDLGMTNLTDVVTEVARITAVTDLPLLVDIDTGWGSELTLERAVNALIQAGAAGVHIEDQAGVKRCGHRPSKTLAPQEEMVARLCAAVDARSDDSFVIMARSDAFANEGMPSMRSRLSAYVEAGADMVFPEALNELAQYREIVEAVKVPVLANITEFGRTPLFPLEQLAEAGVGIALYPLSAFRAMSYATELVYHAIREEGSQASQVPVMQTREALYDVLNYYDYEEKVKS